MSLKRVGQLTKKPIFSIIIPVYNVEQYLSFCLASVVNQTMIDIEIICVNDGSTDNSLKIVQEFAGNDNRIHVVNKQNGGLSSARNAGLAIASGEYILFVDSDDMLYEDACNILYREILERKPDIVVFGTEVIPQYRNNEEKKWLEYILQVDPKYYKNDSITALFNEKASKPYVWNECYKSEILQRNNIMFDEEVYFGEDMVFLFELFPNANSISYIPNKLYKYRFVRDDSLMSISRKNKEWRLEAHMIIVDKILGYWDKKQILEKNKAIIYKWCLNFLEYDITDVSVDENVRKNVYKQLREIIQKYGFSTAKKDRETRRKERKLKAMSY